MCVGAYIAIIVIATPIKYFVVRDAATLIALVCISIMVSNNMGKTMEMVRVGGEEIKMSEGGRLIRVIRVRNK